MTLKKFLRFIIRCVLRLVIWFVPVPRTDSSLIDSQLKNENILQASYGVASDRFTELFLKKFTGLRDIDMPNFRNLAYLPKLVRFMRGVLTCRKNKAIVKLPETLN